MLKAVVHKSNCTFMDSYSRVQISRNVFKGTGGGTGNLATVNDEAKNIDLKLLLEMAYPYKGKDHRYVVAQNLNNC